MVKKHKNIKLLLQRLSMMKEYLQSNRLILSDQNFCRQRVQKSTYFIICKLLIYQMMILYFQFMQITKNQLNSYTLKKTLGRGTFGKVKLGFHCITGEPVAIKILQKNKIKDVTDVERVSRQLHILKITQHASIAQMYQIIENQTTIFIVMEYAPHGEFFDYIMDGKIKSEAEVHYYFVQIVRALEYLHRLNISHRDVKPENMLLDYQNRLKIVDFGLSNMYSKGQKLLTACGSPCYASPEMIKGQQYDPQLTDVWSLGVVLFSMVMAKLPFEDDNTSVLYSKIKSGLYILDKKISNQLRQLISKLLCVDPTKRFTLEMIKNHPWFKKQKPLRLLGIRVGFQSVGLDGKILENMKNYGYDIGQAKRYLENNIRNQITAAYYLLMKKNFIDNNPSQYDISNEKFDPQNVIPKISLFTQQKKKQPQRHKSFDLYLSLKQLQKFDDKSTGRGEKKSEKMVKKERKCYSQMKSHELQKGYRGRLSKERSQNSTSFNKSMKRYSCNHRYNNIFRQKQSEKSMKSIQKKSSKKNLQKQHNISINVYINNAKIQAPSHLRDKKKKSNKKLNLQKQIVNLTRAPSHTANSRIVNKRLKTEDIRFEQNSLSNTKDRKETSFRQAITRYTNHNQSIQKSTQIPAFDDGNFWKKKSQGHRRQYTTQSRADRSRYRYH